MRKCVTLTKWGALIILTCRLLWVKNENDVNTTLIFFSPISSLASLTGFVRIDAWHIAAWTYFFPSANC